MSANNQIGAPERALDSFPRAAAITPSNTADLTPSTTRLFVGAAGDVFVDMVGNSLLPTGTQATAVGTLTLANASGAVGSTIGGTLVTVTAEDSDDAATALLLATAMDADPETGPKVNATVGGAGNKVVTLTATVAGPAQNYALTAVGTGVTRSGATLTGGTLATGEVIFGAGGAGAVGATINGHLVTVAWNTDATTTGDDFVTELESDPDVGGAFSSAVNNAGTVTITITNPVAAATANAYTLVASGTDVTVSGATFGTGGAAVAAVDASGTLTLSGVTGVVGGSIDGDPNVTVNSADADDAATAILLADEINNDATVNLLVEALAAAKVVTMTAVAPGKFGNAITNVASGTGVTASGATLTGGTGGEGNYLKLILAVGFHPINVSRVYALGTDATDLRNFW